jgi:hypothetical protein
MTPADVREAVAALRSSETGYVPMSRRADLYRSVLAAIAAALALDGGPPCEACSLAREALKLEG